MRFLWSTCFLAAASLIPSTWAAPAPAAAGSPDAPVIVTPGPPEKSRITEDNTLNGTASSANATSNRIFRIQATPNLPISITNSFSGGQLYAYITGLDTDGRVVMLQRNGQWYYPTSSSSTVPQKINADITLNIGGRGSTVSFYLPSYLSSGRVYISEGELTFSALQVGNSVTLVQPDFNNPSDSSAGKNWGFIELTNNAGGLYANLSFVDFVGLPLGMTLTTNNGQSTTVRGVNAGAVNTLCSNLRNYAGSDGAPWDQLCQYRSDGTPLRAVAPQKYIAVHPGAFSNYYSAYVDKVWQLYRYTPLTINSQGGAGTVRCRTIGDTLYCNGGNRGFVKPSASEIFGCDGTFGTQNGDNGVVLAATARICAAFSRSTLLLFGGATQPQLSPTRYFSTSPTNRYAQLVHQVELDGRGYAFPYDDVNPSGGVDQSGTLASGDARSLTITVGGA